MSFAEILKFWLPARSKNRMCRSQHFNQICLDRGCEENVGISMTIPAFACYSQYIDKKLILKIRKRMLKVGKILSLGDFMTSLFWLHSWCSSPQKQIKKFSGFAISLILSHSSHILTFHGVNKPALKHWQWGTTEEQLLENRNSWLFNEGLLHQQSMNLFRPKKIPYKSVGV